jgi:hypothetical protein
LEEEARMRITPADSIDKATKDLNVMLGTQFKAI